MDSNLLRASKTENIPLVQHILSISTTELDIQDTDGYTPLHYAVSNSSIKLVEYLLKKGANPNLRTIDELKTPLHLAIDIHQSYYTSPSLEDSKVTRMAQQKHIMILLLSYEAYPFFSDISGATFSALLNKFASYRLKELTNKFPGLLPPPKLRTLAAKKIIRSGLLESLTPHIPKQLRNFITFHIPLSETPRVVFTEMTSASYVH